MSTLQAFCAVEQRETPHRHTLDHNGNHLLVCESPMALVKACHRCVSETEHQDDAHGEHEFRAQYVDERHHRGGVYAGTCQGFVKLPASFSIDDVKAHLKSHKQANDRRGRPEPPCPHRFSTVAKDVTSSTCDLCGKTHGELFRGETAPA